MRTLEDIWPLFGLRITAGPLELRPVADADIPGLVALAVEGIHPADRMPFSYPWTNAPRDELPRDMAAYYWRTRAGTTPDRWTVDFAVRRDGELVGVQGFGTDGYLVTRTGETGSWLGRRHQGRGTGTLMRQTLCAFLFDHLDAEEITSAAFLDNPASLAVSRKVGYLPNGDFRERRRPGEMALNRKLRLTEPALVRHEHEVRVDGLAPVRRLLGLDRADGPDRTT